METHNYGKKVFFLSLNLFPFSTEERWGMFEQHHLTDLSISDISQVATPPHTHLRCQWTVKGFGII